jgi:hypothetical protein
MVKKNLGLLAVAAMVASFSARAQLTSVTLEDNDGLMFANVVDTAEAGASGSLGGPSGQGQAWIAALNAQDYGGYNNWMMATGDSTYAPNNTTNQLGQLFGVDCANMSNCSSFTALTNSINAYPYFQMMIGSSSLAPYVPGCYGVGCGSTYYIYSLAGGPGILAFDVQPAVMDVIAVRDVVAAPELDVSTAWTALTLLIGGTLVLMAPRKEAGI